MAKQEPAAGGGTPSPPVPSAGQKEPKQDPHGLSGSMGGEGNLPDEKGSAKHEADAQAVEATQEPAAGGDAPSTPPAVQKEPAQLSQPGMQRHAAFAAQLSQPTIQPPTRSAPWQLESRYIFRRNQAVDPPIPQTGSQHPVSQPGDG